MNPPNREPRMAGTWYPGEVDILFQLLESLRASAEGPRLPASTRLAGLVAPHAGYRYSGRTAARAYATLGEWRPRRVVVVAPSHREGFAGVSAWSPQEGRPATGAWRTPLGEVEVDLAFLERLRGCPGIHFGQAGHREEHALELQLPFLQHALGGFRLAPLVLGDQGAAQVLALGRALAQALTPDLTITPTLLVASSDLSHFHSRERARELDQRFLADLERADERAMLGDLAAGDCEACGGGPAAAVLHTCRQLMPKLAVDVLDYSTSADETGDERSVVGYGAVLIREADHA